MTLSPLQIYIVGLRSENRLGGLIEIVTDTAKSSKPRNNNPKRNGRRLSLSRWESAPNLDDSSHSLPSLPRNLSNSSDEMNSMRSSFQSYFPSPVDLEQLDNSDSLDTSSHSLPSQPSQVISSRGTRSLYGTTGHRRGGRRARRGSLDSSFKPCFQSRNFSEFDSSYSTQIKGEGTAERRGGRQSRRASLDSLHLTPRNLDNSSQSSLQLPNQRIQSDNSESLDVSSHSLPNKPTYCGKKISQERSSRASRKIGGTSGTGSRRARRGSLDSSLKPCSKARNVTSDHDTSHSSRNKDKARGTHKGSRQSRRSSLDSLNRADSSRTAHSPPPQEDDNRRCLMRSAKGTRNLDVVASGSGGAKHSARRASLDSSFQSTDRWNISSELDVSSHSSRNTGETMGGNRRDRPSRRASIDCLPSLPTRNNSLNGEDEESSKKEEQTKGSTPNANTRSPRRGSLDSLRTLPRLDALVSLDEHFLSCSSPTKQTQTMDNRSIADSLELVRLQPKGMMLNPSRSVETIPAPLRRKQTVEKMKIFEENFDLTSKLGDALQALPSMPRCDSPSSLGECPSLPRCDSPSSLGESSHTLPSPRDGTTGLQRMLVNPAC